MISTIYRVVVPRKLHLLKAIVGLALCSLLPLCEADNLRDMVEKGQPKETKLGQAGTRMWTVEQEDAYSPMFGQTFVWVRMGAGATWRVRNVQRSAPALEAFVADNSYEREVSIQGGFFGEDPSGKRYPLGLIISDGKRISKKVRWTSGGAIYQQGGVTKIAHVSELPAELSAQQAIQSKPLVVEAGKNGIYTPDAARFNRVAVGISRSGSIVIAGAFSPKQEGATLSEFADALVAFGVRNKDELVSAIAMDGGPGAHIYVSQIKRLYGYDGSTFVPNVADFGLRSRNK